MDSEKLDINAVCFGILCNFNPVCGEERAKVEGYAHITMFDKPYPPEKQAEGLAISQAIVGGHCDKCGFLPQCSTQGETFRFPAFAWCMQRKAVILREMER